MKRRAALMALLASAGAPAAAAASPQSDLDRLANQLGYRFTVIDNNPERCPTPGAACFLSEIAITTPQDLPPALADKLEIRLSFVSGIAAVESDVFTSRLINGDYNALTLKPGARLRPGTTYRVRLTGGGHFFSTAYPMPNAHLVVPGLASRTIAATRAAIDPETRLETLPFVAPMTDEANLGTSSPEDRNRWLTPDRAFGIYSGRLAPAQASNDIVVLPKPMSVTRLEGAALDLRQGVRLAVAGSNADQLATALDHLRRAGVADLRSGVPLRIEIGAQGLASEAYRLTADAGGIMIQARDAAGASYALRSLAQQVAHEEGRLRPIRIEDAPRFPFRGLHIDVARNFHSKEELLKLVEQLAVYKLNKLHLHLGEDEGWRLEVKALPELANVGGFRCYDDSESSCLQPQLGAAPERDAPVNGFLTQADYLDILRAAKARHIEVIPSFDMPGHSRAAIRSMEARYRRLMAEGKPAEAAEYRLVEPGDTTRYRSIQNYDDNTLNVCIDNTYRFLDTVLGEVAALHNQAGTPLATYHIGADETAGAWSESPACKAMMAKTGLEAKQLGGYFIERVANSLAAKGIRPAGWSDGMGHTNPARMPQGVQSNIWGGLFGGGVAEAHDHLNRGWNVVLSIPDYLYLDMPYAPHPQEPGYDWASRGIDTFKLFSFMPENLPANAAVATERLARPGPLEDKTPIEAGRRIIGIQGQLWSETVRTDDRVEYMLFPRLLALAERAWHRPQWEPAYNAGQRYEHGDARVNLSAIHGDWQDFSRRLAAHLPMLDEAEIDYRLAPPGARIVGGRLEAVAEFPSLPIEYRVGGGAWQRYQGPVAVNGPVTVRTRTPDGRRAGRSAVVGGV
jgi:hexosaminidase